MVQILGRLLFQLKKASLQRHGTERLGTDVMYDHNFLGFCQFSAKKLPFFSKINVMVTVSKKNTYGFKCHIFAKFFGEIFFNHNIGPKFVNHGE
jgi:hypothetical protein